jgi:hypothetical protein
MVDAGSLLLTLWPVSLSSLDNSNISHTHENLIWESASFAPFFVEEN